MTVNEIASGLAKATGQDPSDWAVKRQLLATHINPWRATIIEQTVTRHPGRRSAFATAIKVEMTKTGKIFGIDIQCNHGKSLGKIPTPLAAGATLFDYVGSIDGTYAFGRYEEGTDMYLAGKYSAGLFRYRFDGDFIWTNQKPPKVILAKAIWLDPEALYKYNHTHNNISNSPYDFWNSEYPSPDNITQRAIQSILSVDFRRAQPTDSREVQVNAETDS
jgi:hypothetical protein